MSCLMLRHLVIGFAIFFHAQCLKVEMKSYRGYTVVSTVNSTAGQIGALMDMGVAEEPISFWAINKEAEIMASPRQLPNLTEILKKNDIKYKTIIEDVQKLLDDASTPSARRHFRDGKGGITFDDYNNHATINDWLDELAEKYANVQVVDIGKSYEGRIQKLLKITKAGPGKPNVIIQAGAHAREWASISTATYLIYQLTKPHNQFADHINFHILPVVNPDGYEYSISSDRLWRKTRSRNPGSSCTGTDLNRNWNFKWGVSGSSSNPCADTYMGKKPGSEIELRNLVKYVSRLKPKPILVECLHSYGNLILYPFGYDHRYPINVYELRRLAKDVSRAIPKDKNSGEAYRVVNAAELYPASGASDDWYKGYMDIRFVYTFELRGMGRGFLLPPRYIRQSGREIWEGTKVLLTQVMKLSTKCSA